MNLSEEKQGEIIIFFEAALWGLFPVITILSFKNVSPLISLGWSTLFATIFFALVISVKRRWQEMKNKAALKDILLTTLILGVVYYLLFFTGLHYTSAGNAGIIALTEVFFSFLFFHVWRKDHIPATHIVGAILMLIGAAIVLYPNFSKPHSGDILILAASFIAPLGNFFQRSARQKVSSESILFIRCLISAPVIFLFAYLTRADFAAADFKKSFIFLALNGFFLLGLSKILWIEGIHRISVTKATALGSIAPLLTLLFAWLLLNNTPTKFQLFSLIPMFFGVMFLSKNKKY